MSLLFDRVRALLEGAVDDPAAEAAELLASLAEETGAAHATPIPGEALEARALALAQRRKAGEPLGYLTGRVRFMGLRLIAAPGALVPRPETELLGETAAAALQARAAGGEGLTLLDLCCGAGNLACGITARLTGLRTWACDLTDGAVNLARRNAEALGLTARLWVDQGDLFGALAGHGLEGGLDAIVCNPPYISTGRLAKDRAALLVHEPREAFDGGPYGLSIHQRVVREAPRFLKPGGTLSFEIGLGQERQLALLFDRSGAFEPLALHHDREGRPRVASARLPG